MDNIVTKDNIAVQDNNAVQNNNENTSILDLRSNLPTYRIRASYSFGINTDNSDYHKHAVYDIYIQLEKSVTYYVEDTKYDLKAGDVLLINSHELHKMPNEGDMNFRRLIILFEPKTVGALSSKYTDLLIPFNHNMGENNIIHLSATELNQLCIYADEIIKYNEMSDIGGDLLCLSVLIRVLIMIGGIYRKQYANQLQTMSDRVHMICKYIDDCTPKIKSVTEVAQKFAMSRSHISKIFKEETGITIGEYITKQKINFAVSLLELGFNASDVSYVSGFCDYASFYRTLKKRTGKSPRDFKTPVDSAPDHRLDLSYYL